jgi:hypothetical protein
MGILKDIPPEQVPLLNAVIAKLTTFSEKGAPEAFRWLGWSVAIAAVQLAAIKTDSWELKVIPWILFFLLGARILWALGMTAKPEDESKPVTPGKPKVVFRSFIGAALCWGIAYQIAFALPSKIVEADLLPVAQQQTPASVTPPSAAR